MSAPTEDSIVSVEVSPEDPPFFAPIVSTPEPTAAPPSEAPGPTETRPASEQPAGDFEIDVPKGVGSGVICAMLEDAGAVADARDFERFLYENGKETRLRYGKMRIPYNSDYYGIMEIISN